MNSVQPSFQTNSQPMGIGPGGMDLTSYFMAQSKQSPRKTSIVGGGANTSSNDITNKVESEANMMHNYSSEQNQLSKSQNLNNCTGYVNQNNEFSPENTTQFTILKAKLFNP